MLNTCVADVGSAKTLLQRAAVIYRQIGFSRLGASKNMSSAKGSNEKWDLSDVARIEEVVDHPIELFRMWHKEARRYNPVAPDVCCLATTSKHCKVSARNVVLREFDNEGFVIVTDSRSKKIDDIENVPYAAMCYLWFYINEQEQEITKQVRIEGNMKKLKREHFQHLYDREPLFCKIRSHLCDQGRKVDWNELKQRHDKILELFRRTENGLPMPDHFVGYKLLPTMMEFYFARDNLIADRILYRKSTSNDSWENHRIAA